MSKKVLIISGSPRKNGNSDILCEQFKKGAEESGNQVEKVFLRQLTINPCVACYGCRETKACIQRDDMKELLDKMVEADVLVLATPGIFLFYGRSVKDHDRPDPSPLYGDQK